MELAKTALGKKLAAELEDGQTISVGTGSTVDKAVAAIAARIKSEGLRIKAFVTSYNSGVDCAAAGLTVVDSVAHLAQGDEIAMGFDGADEFDKDRRLIKGAGAALLREKILAAQCKRFIILADESKRVSALGIRFAVPIEIVPESLGLVKRRLVELDATEIKLRDAAPGKHGPVITERGNLLLDARFASIPSGYEKELNSIPGVVDNGIFENYASEIWVADESGVVSVY